MFQLSVKELATVVSGDLKSSPFSEVRNFGTDTRKNLSGQLFVALKGDQFDGHDFLQAAANQGAHCLLIHDDSQVSDKLCKQVSVIVVKDTLLALQELANWWRHKNSYRVIGVTGSNGKTTCKEMVATLLKNKFKISYSKGSFNNHWGVPFSLLDADPQAEIVILEMGMNHQGEIKRLCEIAHPDIVVCTMVGTAHIGELGSQANIAKAKWEIYENSPGSTKIFNFDNEHTIEMYEKAQHRWKQEKFLLFSSFRPEAQVVLRALESSLDGLKVSGTINGQEGECQLQVVGRHNVVNLSAAVSVSLAVGLSPDEIWQSMPQIQGEWGRNQIVHTQSGAKILFDGYNANPDSMAALVKNLFETYIEGKKLAILGQMYELGDFSAEKHRQLGEMIGNTDLEVVWFIGPSAGDFEAGLRSSGFGKTYFISEAYEESLAFKIRSMLHTDDMVVVKGSRAMKLERVVEVLEPINFQKS